MQGTLLVVKKFELWEHVVKYYNQFTFQHQWKALGPEIKDQANMWLYNISTLHLSLFLHVLWLLWCVYTQCTSPTISWKIPKMASLEGSFFSSEDTTCKHTHTAVSYVYIYDYQLRKHELFIHGIKFKLSSDKKKVTQRCTMVVLSQLINSDLKHIIHERINIHLAGWQISWWWAPKLNPERIHCYCTVIVHVPNT